MPPQPVLHLERLAPAKRGGVDVDAAVVVVGVHATGPAEAELVVEQILSGSISGDLGQYGLKLPTANDGLAVAFGIWVTGFHGGQYGLEFFTGWLTEYSLSVDNLFIFIIIMASFKVPRVYQQEALMIGIILALIFRGIFIGLGAAAINNFSWVFYIFGLFLVYTAYGLVKSYRNHDDEEAGDNAVVRFAERHFSVADEFHGMKMTVHIDGKRFLTPMFLVIVPLGTTDPLWVLLTMPLWIVIAKFEGLVAPETITTVPPATLDAFRDHGTVHELIGADAEADDATLAGLNFYVQGVEGKVPGK